MKIIQVRTEDERVEGSQTGYYNYEFALVNESPHRLYSDELVVVDFFGPGRDFDPDEEFPEDEDHSNRNSFIMLRSEMKLILDTEEQ